MNEHDDEFLKFGMTKPEAFEPGKTVAKSRDGTVWVRVENDVWETVDEPKRTRGGLSPSELYLLLQYDRSRRR